jgi:hypothetical protein
MVQPRRYPGRVAEAKLSLIKLLTRAGSGAAAECRVVLRFRFRLGCGMRHWSLWLFSVVFAAAAPEYVVDDFEADAVRSGLWSPSGGQPGRAGVTDAIPAFSGRRSLRVTVFPGDNRMIGRQSNPTERYELTLRRPQVQLGREVWYAFALRVPADFPTAATRTIIHQFKENVRPVPPGMPAEVKHCEKASPAFALYLEAGRRLVALTTSSTACDHTRHVLAERPLAPDRWYEIMVHTRPAHEASGFLDLYLDGELIGQYRGVMGYVCHGLGHIDTQPRFGIYRDAHPQVGPATLYYDAIRFAADRAGLRRGP